MCVHRKDEGRGKENESFLERTLFQGTRGLKDERQRGQKEERRRKRMKKKRDWRESTVPFSKIAFLKCS